MITKLCRLNRRITPFVELAQRARDRSISYLIWKARDICNKRVRKYTYRLEPKSVSRERIRRFFPLDSSMLLRDYLRTRNSFRFFFDQEELPEILNRLSNCESDYVSQLVDKADRICQHRIPILAVGETYLGECIDWSKDYRSGLRWGKEYAFDYDLLDLERPSDVRIVWELNRLHFLVDLGKAYRATGDRKYALKFKELVADWQKNNPVAYSINWACAMEAAIRSVNLIWALMLFLPADDLDDDFLWGYLRLLILHGRFIFRNLEYSDVRGNHYLADLIGLVYLGLFLPEYPESKRWLDYALPRLDTEMQHQVHPDGVSHEGSIPYHRLVTELFMSVAILLKRNGLSLAPTTMQRLEKMVEFVGAYTKPDGLCPLLGDGDDGRLHVLGNQHINDHRYLLSTGAVIFRRGDFKHLASRFWEESAWLLGIGGWNTFEKLAEKQPRGSISFRDGGFFVMKQERDYLIVDCGDTGLRGRGGHGHNDMLSFELVLNGDNLVSDTGCASYTADKTDRVSVISTRAHNTATVDKAEMAEISELGFISAGNTPGRLITWTSDENQDEFVGEHYGFRRLSSPVIHRRTIRFKRKSRRVIVLDAFMGQGRHTIAVYFHFDPDCMVEQTAEGIYVRCSTSDNVYVLASDAKGGWQVVDSYVYPRYGIKCPAKVAVFEQTLDLPASFRFEFSAVPKLDILPK